MSSDGHGIFLNGAYGVGKSSTLDHLADLFAEAELPFSLFDVDWFHRSWPPASTDPHNVLTEADNMRAVWRNYLRAGPRTPVIAGVITRIADAERYEEIVEMPLRIVHLTASSDVAERRLRGRYTPGRHRALTWHLENRRRVTDALDRFPAHDLVVDTDHRTPAEVAALVFDEFAPTSPR